MEISATLGERLLKLKAHSGMSLSDIASAAGYAAPSSIQKLFRYDYDQPALSAGIARRLAKAFVGKGRPPITSEEVLVLANLTADEDTARATNIEFYRNLPETIGVIYSKPVIDELRDIDGVRFAAMKTGVDRIGRSIPCPVHIRERGITGIYLSISAMSPRYEIGEIVFFESMNPPLPGDDVFVDIESGAGSLDGKSAFSTVGRMFALRDDEVVIDQISPPRRLRIGRGPFSHVSRIMRPVDFLPPIASKVVPYA